MTRQRWITLAVAGAVVLAIVALLVVNLSGGSNGSASGASNAAVATTTAKIVRTDLVAQQQVTGTLGYAGSYTVVNLYKPPTSTSTPTSASGSAAGSGTGTSASAASGSGGSSGTVTALPALGATITQGQSLYSVDTIPVSLLYGPLPAYRAFANGMSDGPDVAQLEQGLVSMGYATSSNLTVDNHFNSSTASAISRWQQALGVTATGSLPLGEVVFLPGPIRVTNLNVSVGAPAGSGTTIMTGTSTDRVVTVALDVSQQYLVKPGDPVTVALPDGKTTVDGTVYSVSPVATSSSTSSAAAGQATQGQNSAPTATIPVTIVLTNPAAAGGLDQAPVTVNITSQSAKGVLAVPINALLALASGGYGVELVGAGSATRLVPVQTGLFANTQVEVRGTGLAAGQNVQVPAP
jgi:peptidoglycan hydrolase-like protein with peptidoglycan-binding domain